MNISYNTVNNNNGSGVNHIVTLRGIYAQAGTSANATINNNTVTIQSGATTSACTGIDNLIGSTAASNTVTINNNTVNCAYTTATSGIFTGISNTASAATVNINVNTITGVASTNLAGTGTHVMIETGSPTTVTASNNTITNLSRSGASGSWRGIKLTSPTNFTGNSNTIDGLSWTAAASTGSIDAFYSFSSAVNVTASSNIIRNLSTPTTGTITGITEFGTSGLKTYQNNQIYNFFTTAGGAGGATLRGISESTGSTNTYSGNLIYSLNSTGTTGGTGGTIVGITFSSGTTNNVTNNAVYDLSSTSTNPIVTGINIGGGTTNNINNNLIGDLRATASTGNVTISGILAASGTTNNIYHNTVNIAATTTSASTFGTSAIYFSSSTPVNNLRNNVFVNTSSPGPTGGFTAAIRYTVAPTSTNFPAANNNNFYYAGVAAVNKVLYGEGSASTATNGQQTIAAYKTYINTTLPVPGRESASVSEVPNWVSTTGSNPITTFLKYNTGIATQIEQGGGIGTGISTDYSGTTRCPGGGCPGSTAAPDMGAWELNGIAADFTGPSITYTNLSSTGCTSNRTLTGFATINDGSGVNVTAGTKPRLYYKKSTDANTYVGNTSADNGWKYVEASNAVTPFSFTIDYSIINGGSVTAGDMIQYFVVAQDNAGTPNIGINSGTFAAAPTSVALTSAAFPLGGTINSYTISAAGLSGTVNVGAAETYKSLTETGAGGLFNAVTSLGLTGNTTVNLMDASITETGAVALGVINNTGCSAGTFTLTIKPNTATVLTGVLASGALIKLSGADNVIIDGSNSGGTDRSLTITNTSTTSPTAIWISSLGIGAGATNNTVKNCNISTGSNAATSYGIAIAGATLGSGGADNDNVTIQNNNITQVYHAVWANGTSSTSTGGLDVLNINNNTVGPVVSGATNIGFSGVNIANAVSPSITLNTIQNIAATGTGAAGILTTSTVAGATISQNTVQNLTTTSPILYGILVGGASGIFSVTSNTISAISGGTAGANYIAGIEVTVSCTLDKNNVAGVSNNSTSTYGAYGINVNGGNNTIVKNNFISGVTGDMTGGSAFSTTFGIFGIRIATGTGHQIYHNSVNLYGLRTGTATSSLLGAAFCLVSTSSTGCDVRNNIFANTLSGGTTSLAYTSVYLPSGGTSAMNLTWNNNAYYSGTDAASQGIAQVGSTAGTGFYLAVNFNKNSTAGSTNFRNYSSTLLAANTNNDNASYAFSTAAPFTTTSNLHINSGVTPIGLESGGASVGIVVDYDGQVRPGPAGSVNGGATAADIGADEFDGVPEVPMTYTSSTTEQITGGAYLGVANQAIIRVKVVTTGAINPLSLTSLTLNANGTTAITDINASTAKVYYTGTSTVFNTGTLFGSATPTIANFTVTGTQTLVEGNNYFWLAYDVISGATPGNVIDGECTSLMVAAIPRTPTIQAPAGNKVIVGPMSGNYNVGSAQTFPNFATLTSAISDLNGRGISGAVTLTLMDALYSTNETYPLVINAVTGASATNTVKIKPGTGVTATITGASASGAIIKDLSSFLIIDGSNNGTTTRNLTISNTSTTSPSVIQIFSTGLTPITKVRVKNSNLINGINSSTALVLADATSTSSSLVAGYFTNDTIQNNSVQKAYMGLYAIAAVAAGNGAGYTVKDNDLTTTGANALRYVGIYLQGVDGGTVENNTIGNFSGTESEDDKGIWLATGTVNTNVLRNTITNLNYTGTGGYGGQGIYISSSVVAANIKVANNMIANLTGDGWNYTSVPTDNPIGIVLTTTGTQSGISLFFNSINLTGNTLNQASAMSMGIYMSAGSTADIRNNIIVNKLGLLSATGYGSAGVYAVTSNAQFTDINYNDYIVAPTGSGLKFIGQIAASGSSTLLAWQGATTKDANSVSIAPIFTSATNLRLPYSSNGALNNLGTPIAGITTDIDSYVRSTTAPDMGAEEIKYPTKVFLSHVDAMTGLMGTYLSTLVQPNVPAGEEFPLSDPYSTTPWNVDFVHVNAGAVATTTAAVRDQDPGGPNAIVDWIFIELRTGVSGSTTVVYTKAALLQSDGDIVEASDGITPAKFINGIPAGNYYIAIRHRNHLGFRTANTFALPSNPVISNLNLTNNSVLLNGSTNVHLIGSYYAMWGGDSNRDRSIDGSDQVDWASPAQFGNYDLYKTLSADWNLDGSVDGLDIAVWLLANGLYEELD